MRSRMLATLSAFFFAWSFLSIAALPPDACLAAASDNSSSNRIHERAKTRTTTIKKATKKTPQKASPVKKSKTSAKKTTGSTAEKAGKPGTASKQASLKKTKVSRLQKNAGTKRYTKTVRAKKSVSAARCAKSGNSTPRLHSTSAVVFDETTNTFVFEKNADVPRAIASITKLMTAMVTLDAGLPMDHPITITDEDVDTLRNSSSRLPVGTTMTRAETLRLALMASENRAAFALARTYPGGRGAFVAAMNRKARELGMNDTFFRDPTGLSSENISTASDLVTMVKTASTYPLIRIYSTDEACEVPVCGRETPFRNTNALVREGIWDIDVSKTGYIKEAGRCLVMHTTIKDRPMVMVLLNAGSSALRINDAKTLKNWVESSMQNTFSQGTAKGADGA